MLKMIIQGVEINKEKIITNPDGDILHGIKKDANGFVDFGEAYFSIVNLGAVKAWKRHRLMTLNIVVPVGGVLFVLHDQRKGSSTYGSSDKIVLSRSNYVRLTVPPMVWFGFKGVGPGESVLLNIADIAHDPNEIERKNSDFFNFDWGLR